MAGHQAGNFQASHLISRHVAYLPGDVVPFMVPQHHRRLALLSKRRGKLFLALVVNSQLQRYYVKPRAVRINPQRETIKLAPVFAVELPSNAGTAPPTTVFRPWDVKPGGQTHTERLSAVARALPREPYLGNCVAVFIGFLNRPSIHDLRSAGREGGPMRRVSHIVQDPACQYLFAEPAVGRGVLKAIR